MVKLGNKDCIPFRGYYKPVAIYQGRKPVFEPITTPLTGEGIIAVEHTYDDKLDLLTIYGKSEQDGTPSPDAPVEIQSVGGTLTVANEDGSQAVTIEIPTLYSVDDVMYVDRTQKRAWVERNLYRYGNEFRVSGSNTNNMYTSVNSLFTNSGIIACSHFISGGSSTRANTIHQWVQQRIYVSPSSDDLFPASEFNTWVALQNDFEVLVKINEATIEELDYTPLPTFPKYTTLVYEGDNDVTPTMKATLKRYKSNGMKSTP